MFHGNNSQLVELTPDGVICSYEYNGVGNWTVDWTNYDKDSKYAIEWELMCL